MTGPSARESLRPARRTRPALDGNSANAVAPVLFRLPSISSPVAPASFDASTRVALGGSATVGASQGGASHPASLSPHQPSLNQWNAQAAPRASAARPAELEKKAGQRWLNTLIVVLLLIALVIVSLMAFRKPAVKPDLVKGQADKASDPLSTLADLRVPEMGKPSELPGSTPGQPTKATTPAVSEPAGGLAWGSTSSAPPLAGDAQSASESLIPTSETRDATRSRNSTAQTAHVQLGIPVPLQPNSSSLVDANRTTTDATRSELPVTTPRYETVSAPSPTKSPVEKPRDGGAGASPTLYDGAKNTPEADLSLGGGLTLPKPAGALELSSSKAGDNPTPSSATVTGHVLEAADSELQLLSQNAPAAAGDSVNLGVTVGGGLAHPDNLAQQEPSAHATSTPDMDAAAISKKYLEHIQLKNAKLAASGTNMVNANGAAGPAGSRPAATAPANTPYAGNPYAGNTSAGSPNAFSPGTTYQANSAYQTNNTYGASSAPTASYGTNGTPVTPYVRNAPGAPPNGLTSGTGSASSSVGYPINSTTPTAGYSIPARGPSYPSLTANVPGQTPTYSAQSPGAPTQNYSAPSQNYAHPSQNYSAPQPSYAPAGPSGSPTSGAFAPSGGATYPGGPQSVNPYPGGQAPVGMIGQSGYATAPSGDLVGGAPLPVTGTIGYATSTVGGLPADARPTGAAASGSSPSGAANPYGAVPQYR